jgi:hypothetical protein
VYMQLALSATASRLAAAFVARKKARHLKNSLGSVSRLVTVFQPLSPSEYNLTCRYDIVPIEIFEGSRP